MAQSKNYLNVPYAEKEAAKVLGARWDAKNKKWYAPSQLDLSLFSKWQSQAIAAASTAKPKRSSGVITYAKDKHFIAYCGDEPPWN